MRNERLDMRVTAEEKARWEAFADKQGLKLSELVRRSVNNLIRLASETKQKGA